MGRSATSCFKIMTCGSDSVDGDDLQASDSKASSDKRGWSFRKRSARHRVLSNTVISEASSSVNKESPESANIDLDAQAKSANPEKSPGMQWTNEVPHLSTSINSKSSEAVAVLGVDTEFVIKPEESVVIVIQAAIRRLLAEKELLKHKNIVKLQAAVRGHLVRRRAVGSLRCVQAIIKMQALVRARRTRLSGEGSTVEVKLHEKTEKETHITKLQGEQKSGAKSDVTYTSIEKLLSNRFARQLLESSPRTKSINIKCDPSTSDSAWKWLERWVSVSPTKVELLQKQEPSKELEEQENVRHPENQTLTLISAEDDYESTNLSSNTIVAAVPHVNSDAEETARPYEKDENLVSLEVEQPRLENLELLKLTENLDILPQNRQSDSIPEMEYDSVSGKPGLETEQLKCSMKTVATEQPETEDSKFVSGSKNVGNPAFIAAQSKLAELTSTTNSAKSFSSSIQENDIESCTDAVSSVIDNTIRTKEISLAENSVKDTSRVLVGGSESGTELSISSTLDSPDQSEFGAVEFEKEANISEEGTGNPRNPRNTTYIDVEVKVEPTIQTTGVSFPITVQSEKPDDRHNVVDERFENAIGLEFPKEEQKLSENSPTMQIELEHEKVHQVNKSSPEASPRSHITGNEFQGTPSSQVSTKSRKTKADKTGSNQKPKSSSASKRSPINPSHDSGVRSSLEQLPKDLKTGKRWNSSGSPKPSRVEQEPRDSSCSSHSLPSYMQLTESARAKAYANISAKSSPDAQDKEYFIKKRHSLPAANGRQGSPRIQRSMSQAQQSTKGNGTNSPHERRR